MKRPARTKVFCVYNPRSGRGRAKVLTEKLTTSLVAKGCEVRVVESQRLAVGICYPEIEQCDVVVVVGGDGTLCSHLGMCVACDKPVCFLGAGNESLFRQAFQLPRTPEALAEVVMHGDERAVYFARANDISFFHMCSFGLDADVVRLVDGCRGVSVSNWVYARESLRAAMQYSVPEISLRVDGKEVLHREKGSLIVANHCTYAGDIRPVPEAQAEQAQLVARFFPEQGIRRYLGWAVAYLGKRRVSLAGTKTFSGLRFEINGECSVQIDGEYLGVPPVIVESSHAQVRVVC